MSKLHDKLNRWGEEIAAKYGWDYLYSSAPAGQANPRSARLLFSTGQDVRVATVDPWYNHWVGNLTYIKAFGTPLNERLELNQQETMQLC